MRTNSNKQIDLITKFESMSNELLMELFEYYDLYSLLFSFGSLNSRIDNIIYHCEVSVDFDKIKSNDFIDFISQTLPKFNSKNIRSLKASIPYQIRVLAYDKYLIYFTHIRSLSLNNTHSSIIDHIVSRIHFSRLERVSLGNYESRSTNAWSIFHHFLDSNKYQYLRTYKDSRSAIKTVTSVLSIEYAVCSSPSIPCDFFNFLNRSPCLKYMKAKLEFSNRYPKPVFLLPIPCYNRLTHLNLILLHKVCIETIVYLFKCVPRICQLKLQAHQNGRSELVDPLFWETVLSENLIELKRLFLHSFIIEENSLINPLWNSLPDKKKANEQIEKSNYWSSNQWKATFNRSMRTLQSQDCWAKFQVV